MESYFPIEKITEFWEWFEEHEEKFRIITDPNGVRERLDNQVLLFGIFSWEIGEGRNNTHTFTISPNGNDKMLKRSETIMEYAPDLPKWEFYAAKPSKDWDFTFEMFDSFMMKRTVDAADWEYIIRMTPERKIKILIYTENVDFLDMDDKLVAADLVINNIIGEADKINFVESISFIPFVDEHQEMDIKMMPELQFEFDKIFYEE